MRDEALHVPGLGQPLERLHLADEPAGAYRLGLRPADDQELVLDRGLEVLGAGPELLGELLPGPEPRVGDLDVPPRLGPRGPHQIPRHLGDGHGLAHVEHEVAQAS